jgi:hypothetical protein
VGEYTILGASGEYSDFQSTSVMLDELMYAPYLFLPTPSVHSREVKTIHTPLQTQPPVDDVES